jgi:hypothetical protein
MQAQTLAEQFNDVSAELERRGHGVVVRRARAFIEAGRVALRRRWPLTAPSRA